MDAMSSVGSEFQVQQPSSSEPQPAAQPVMQASQVNLYNPERYLLIGLFLSLIPVFIMSFSNARSLKNGSVVRSTVIKFAIAYGVMMATFIGLVIWCSNSFVQALATNSSLGSFQQFVYQNGNFTYAIANLLLLILLVRSLNKSERAEYRELRAANLVKVRSVVMPILVGLVFSGLVFFSITAVNGYYMAKHLSNTVSTQLLNSVQPGLSDEQEAVPAPGQGDMCGFLNAEKVLLATGLKLGKAAAQGKNCYFFDDQMNLIAMIWPGVSSSLAEEKANFKEDYVTPQDGIQADAFLMKKTASENFYFSRDGKVYYVSVDLGKDGMQPGMAAALGAAIIGVPYQTVGGALPATTETTPKKPAVPHVPQPQ